MDSTLTPSLSHAGNSETNSDMSQCYSPTNKKSWESLGFATVEEIEKFYGNYAYNIGFSIRTQLRSKINSKNKTSDKVHYVRFVCNKEGFKRGSLSNPKNRSSSDSPVLIEFEKVKEKPEERVGCKAGRFLKWNEALNVYKIYRWDMDHCHALHKPEHSGYLRSFREVNEVQGQLDLINSKAGMSMRTSYEVMGQGVGGIEKAREMQKFRLERKKKQRADDEASKTKAGEGL